MYRKISINVKPAVSFLIISIIIILTGCPSPSTGVTLPLTVSWTSFEEENGAIILSWTSEGGTEGHNYLLQKLTSESEWLPEDGISYSGRDSEVPDLLYAGSEKTYTDSSITTGTVYNYRLFAADGGLSYSDPKTLTITLNAGEVSAVQAPLLRSIEQKNYYVNISWEETDVNTSGYIIAKSETPIDWTPENGTSYSSGQNVDNASILWIGSGESCNDTDVQGGRTYYYKIFAYNAVHLYSAGLQSMLLFETESELLNERFPWVDNYIIYYGELTSEAINTAKNYDLAIIHPNNSAVTRDQVRRIQLGLNPGDPDDDVLVVAYVAVGEDLRTYGLYKKGDSEPRYDEMRDDDRFVRNGIGPRVDPRGPSEDGDVLEYDNSIGNISPGFTENYGFASYYLDDNDTVEGIPDGKPDFNESWRCAFVNAGDPLWFQEVDQMQSAADGICGLQELLTTTTGKGLGVDGIFMDALDTCAPNNWTPTTNKYHTKFEWTAPGYADFIMRLKEKYPDKIVVQNRAVFLFRSGFKQKYLKYTTRPYIDFLMFESFRLNSDTSEGYSEEHYNDNRYNYAPPILAEAGREDGFQVLSLGYAVSNINESSDPLASALNSGASNPSLIEDITVTQNIGFRHYLSNTQVAHLNTYVMDKGDLTDNSPPAWTSIYNINSLDAPTPRWGLLAADSPRDGVIKVYWDVAQDKYGVDYYLYYKTSPFDFDGNSQMEGIPRIKLSPRMPKDYRDQIETMSSDIYPFYDEVEGFTHGQEYHLCIRAVDRSTNRNMDTNISNLSLIP